MCCINKDILLHNLKNDPQQNYTSSQSEAKMLTITTYIPHFSSEHYHSFTDSKMLFKVIV